MQIQLKCVPHSYYASHLQHITLAYVKVCSLYIMDHNALSVKLQVAIEFGYDDEQAKSALACQHFDTAGDLVQFLYLLEIGEASITKHEANPTNVQMDTPPKEKEKLSHQEQKQTCLIKETKTFYKRRLCLKCMTNQRNVVTLPCSHLALCTTCYYENCTCPICEGLCAVKIEIYFLNLNDRLN